MSSFSLRRRAFVMSALLLATVLASLDSSFVPIAFPDLIDDLDTATGVVVWVALGYLIAATGPMLFLARLGDAYGYTWLFRAGTALYALAMIACAFAPDIRTLIGIRLAQGLGMAAFLPATFAIATRVYPPDDRGKALGILASGNAFGFILGPVFAGWLLDSYDWRALFWSRIPLALLAIVLAFAAVPRARIDPAGRRQAHYDLRGAALLTASFFGLLYGLNRLPVEDNHLDPLVWVVFVAGFVLLYLFVRHEARCEGPLIDVELFASNPVFSKASLAFAVMFMSFPVYLFLLPLLLIAGLELRAWDAGLLLGVVAVLTFLTSPVAGRLADRFGAATLCTAGALLVMLGYLAMLLVGPASGAGVILFSMVPIGIGTGLFFSPNNSLIMSSVPPEKAGMASGMIGTLRQAGYAVGFAVMASLFTFIQDRFETSWTRQALGTLEPAAAHELGEMFEGGGVWSPEMLVYIFHVGAILAAALLILTLVYSWPRLELAGRRRWLPVGTTVAAALLGVGLYASGSALGIAAPATVAEAGEIPEVAPFGMAKRGARSVAGAEGLTLLTGGEVFNYFCADCHGLDGRGVPDRGLDLTRSAFVRRLDDDGLAEFVRQGRALDDPANQSGQAMLGMKSYAAFEEEHYDLVVAYLRQLQR